MAAAILLVLLITGALLSLAVLAVLVQMAIIHGAVTKGDDEW